jgi:ketosteroid isomerase-like protein
MTAKENINTMYKYFDLLFGKELETLVAMFADDLEWLIIPTGTLIKGKDQLRAGALNHWSASPDRVKKLVNLFATDDYACLEYTSGGTLTGQADFGDLKIKPTGLKYELQCCFVFHFRPDGLIDRVREYFDMETVNRLTGQGSVAASSVK